MAGNQEWQAERPDSMSVDMFLRELQIPNAGPSYLSTQKLLGAPPGPLMRADRENRVIIYCGAFNPPHTGHVACIVDALQHAARDPDLGNFVACIVVPLDDEHLRQKEGSKLANDPSTSTITTPMTLSRMDRADLLSSYIHSEHSGLDDQLRSRVHVWAPAQAKSFTDIPQLLAGAAGYQGFYMDFVMLRSCEYLYHGEKGATRYPRAIHPQCSMVLFTSVGGRNKGEIWQADGSLWPLGQPWTGWEALVMNENLGEGVIRTVWSTSDSTSEQRLLETRNTLKPEPEFSSTQIRRLLYASDFKDPEQLARDLHEAGAIHVGILIQMLADWAKQKRRHT